MNARAHVAVTFRLWSFLLISILALSFTYGLVIFMRGEL